MFVSQSEFAKTLNANAAGVTWSCDSAPECFIVHEWRAVEGGRVMFREYQRVDGSMFWVEKNVLK